MFVLPHQHMVAMTSDEDALWLPQNAGNLFTELQDLISLFAHSKCWHVCVDVLDLKVNVSVLKNKLRYYVSEYSNDIIHQIYCFNTLTNVLKRAALIGDVNTTYDRDSIRYKSTNRHYRKYYRKHY